MRGGANKRIPMSSTVVVVLIVVGVAIVAGLYVNYTVARVQAGLAGTLVDHLEDIDALQRYMSRVALDVANLEVEDSAEALVGLISQAQAHIAEMEDKYEFSDPLGVSVAYARAWPVFADVRLWLTEGVAGHHMDDVVLSVIRGRLDAPLAELSELADRSGATAKAMLAEESNRLSGLRKAMVAMSAVIAALSIGLILLLIKERKAHAQRSAADYALRRSEYYTRGLTETARDAIITCDGDGLIRFWNPAAERLFGFTFDEVLGRSCLMLAPERHRQAYAEHLEAIWETAPDKDVVELKGMRCDGSEFPAEFSVSARSFGQERSLTAIVRDVSARREASRALRLSESRFRDYANAASDSFWELNAKLELTRMARFDGGEQHEDDVMGQTPWEIHGVDLAADPRWSELHRTLLSREPFRDFRFVAHDASGRERHWQASGVPVFATNDRFLGYRGASSEITRQVLATEAAERALRDSERRYRALTEEALEGIVIARGSEPLFVNQSFADMLGFARPSDVMALDSLDDLYAADELARMQNIRKRRALGEDESPLTVFRARCIDGTEIWLEERLRNIEWEGLSATHSTIVDISERKAAEQRVVELSQENERLLNAVGEGIYGVDTEGVITFANPAAARALGYRAEELIGQHAHTLFHHTRADGNEYDGALCPVHTGYGEDTQHGSSEDVFWRKDGTSFPIGYTMERVHKRGRMVGSVIAFRDIGEQQRAKQALSQREALIRLIIDSVPALVAYVTPQKEFLFVNKRCEEWLAYSSSSPPSDAITAIAGEKNDRRLQAAFVEALRGTGGHHPLTRNFPDGLQRNTEVFFVPHRDDGGEVRGVISFVSDLTQQKAVEANLRAAKETADAANRSKSDFLSAMSHDLRTPLNSILGFAELLYLRSGPELTDSERSEAAEQIVKAGDHLLELINEVLDLAQIEGGGLKLTMEAVDVAGVVEECQQLIDRKSVV